MLSAGLPTPPILGTAFDGITGTQEGPGFASRATEVGFKRAVSERDGPFDDIGPSTFKGKPPG